MSAPHHQNEKVTVWLTPVQAGQRLGVSPRTLQRWRTAGQGPRFAQRGQVVRYHVADVDSWMRGSDEQDS